jgi:hypothetical protein
MQGYIFKTETEAIAARKSAADYMGLPKNPNDTTIYWVNYNYSYLDGFYYIMHVDGLEAVFGEPIDITITPHEEI